MKYFSFTVAAAGQGQRKVQQKVYEYKVRPNSGVRKRRASEELTFSEFSNAVQLVTPLDILEQIMPSVRPVQIEHSEDSVDMSLLFGMKSILRLY